MPNLRKPGLIAQIGSFMDTAERAATLKAWATHLGWSHGSLMRGALDLGLEGGARRGDHARRAHRADRGALADCPG